MRLQDKLKVVLCCFCVVYSFSASCQTRDAHKQYYNQENGAKNSTCTTAKMEIAGLLNALKNKNCNAVKTFFNFPVRNEYIWYKVLSEKELEDKDVLKLFTEKDFDTYCNKLFGSEIKDAVNTLNLNTFSLSENFHVRSDSIISQHDMYMYKSVLSIYFDGINLELDVLSSIYDKNGEYLSEHIDKYSFRMLNDSLRFVNFEMID